MTRDAAPDDVMRVVRGIGGERGWFGYGWMWALRGFLDDLVGALFAVIAAWFAILFAGRYPRGLFDFVVGVGRWALRVTAYATLLVTDRYPPFRLA